jgi:hypothetical protein
MVQEYRALAKQRSFSRPYIFKKFGVSGLLKTKVFRTHYFTSMLIFYRYRWAFVSASGLAGLGNSHSDDEIPRPDFVPHVMRIAELMDQKVP